MNLTKSILATIVLLSFGGNTQALSIDVTTLYIYDDTGAMIGAPDTFVIGSVDTGNTGAFTSGTPFLGTPWFASQVMTNETTDSLQNWSGSTSSGTFSYDYTLSAGQIAAGIYMDWSVNEDIAILAVFDCGVGTVGTACLSVHTEGPAPLGTVMKNGPLYSASSGDYFTFAFEGSVSAVPVPAAVWLFGSGFLGLVGVARRKKA